MDTYILDGAFMKDKDTVYDYLANCLPLPSFFGKNLDALYDVLTVMTEDSRIIILNADLLEKNMGEYGKGMLSVFKDAERDFDNIRIELYTMMK